jgi:hypothetical protein
LPDIDQKFRQIFLLLDSDHRGEREAALERIYTLRRLNGWPMFKDMLDGQEKITTVTIDTVNPAAQAEIARLRGELAQASSEIAALKAAVADARSKPPTIKAALEHWRVAPEYRWHRGIAVVGVLLALPVLWWVFFVTAMNLVF